MLLVVRHADAGDKGSWDGPDVGRPLSPAGCRQAEGLVVRLEDYPVERILCSPTVRCHQTVQPLADDRLLRIERIPALGVDATPAEMLALFWDRRLRNAVLCTHGETIGRLLSRLAADGLVAAGDPEPPARRAIVGHSASGATGPPNLIEPDFSAGRPNAGDVASIGTVGDSFENALAESMIILDRTDRSRRAPMPTSEDSPTRARHPARMVDLP